MVMLCFRYGKVLVHCNAGISRAATFVISYLMVYHGMSLELALETVKKARPKVRPNMGFMKQLKSFEESLSTCGA
ncbi:dual specificity phosphatase, catalytic domain protein [Cooperia oncophora]